MFNEWLGNFTENQKGVVPDSSLMKEKRKNNKKN